MHDQYAASAINVNDIDGFGFEFADWRFNVGMSNTELVVRPNVDSRGHIALMRTKTAEVLEIVEGWS